MGLVLLTWGPARAQATAGYGDWQLHLPTNHPLRLADAGDRVYVATENAFYFLDKKLNTTQVLSRRDGLSDVGVVGLAYDSVTRQTVLAYRNANVDILRPNGSVRNLNDILRKPIQGAKLTYRVSLGNGKAFVATSFGLVSIDLAKLEISDTYSNIGPGGTSVAVYDATVASGYLYVATSVGLLRGLLTSNLLDYHNWTALAAPAGNARFVATYGGQVYAAIEGSNAGVYRYTGPGAWQLVPGTASAQYGNLRATRKGLLLTDRALGVRRVDRTNTAAVLIPPPAGGDYTFDALYSEQDDSYYVASYDAGLLRVRPGTGQAAERFEANGPESSLAFGLVTDARSNTVDVLTGGFSDRYLQINYRAGFYEYRDGQWQNFTSRVLPAPADFPNPNNPSRGTRTPDGTLYVASFGGGLLQWKGPGNFRQFLSAAGPASSPILAWGYPNNDRIADVEADADGNVWVANPHGIPNQSGLYKYAPATDAWTVVPWMPDFENLDRLAVDDAGLVWASIARKPNNPGISTQRAGGLYAVDPTPNSGNSPRFFSKSDGLPSADVYELAKDRRGYMWAATSEGVAVFSDASGPFATGTAFHAPRVERGEGSGYAALYTEIVRTMAVDGGDRKWFGTDHGLWLFSPDANEALLHFTTANSPLPSDRIVDVKVNDKTGEVWVATDAGVVSYRGSATVTEGEPRCAAVFPNPVRPDFAGTLGITGLANNAIVKITDIAGHLVYATKASGGTVTWNLTTPDGQRVRAGVYLVLSSDADGKNSCVSKVAVLSK